MSELHDILDAATAAHRAAVDLQGAGQEGNAELTLVPALRRASAAYHHAASQIDGMVERLTTTHAESVGRAVRPQPDGDRQGPAATLRAGR